MIASIERTEELGTWLRNGKTCFYHLRMMAAVMMSAREARRDSTRNNLDKFPLY